MRLLIATCSASTVLFGTAAAQTLFPALPHAFSEDAYVTDAGTDSIFRLQDTNYDGDYNDPGEVVEFYNEDFGPQTLGNNNSIATDQNGRVYIADTSEDIVFLMVDLDGDGTAYGSGESRVFFNGNLNGNESDLELFSPNNLTIDLFNVVWIAEANNGAGGIDSIVRLEDVNLDGDANDAGEATRYFIPTVSGTSTADSIPQGVVVGQDGVLYYLEVSSNGFYEKGVYRLFDADGSGDIDPLTEAAPFFIPPAQALTGFFWNVTQDEEGFFYIADSTNEIVWRFRDENGDDAADPATEAVKYWEAPGSSLIWSVQPSGDGRLLVAESQAPDRVTLFEDLDGNGTIDPLTEVAEVYSEDFSPINISNPRGLTWKRRPQLTVFGDATPGGDLNFSTIGTQADLVLTFFSGQSIAPLLLPPYGELEIDLVTPGISQLLYLDFIPEYGASIVNLPVPNLPSLTGATAHFQSAIGKADRFQLTPPTSVTFN
ncbi:MAG: NHL repeat-containing protein [Planctomycetota bacterium]|jgi:hypothetical protein